MSSTNRGGGVYVRQEDDFYETPAWCVEALLSAIPARRPWLSVFDPCSGRGAILDEVHRVLPDVTGYGVEIDKERAKQAGKQHDVLCADALDPLTSWEPCDAIVTNPPFFCALEFVERALSEAKKYHATVAFLLRLNWLGSKKRRDFHLRRPAALYVMTKRPSFTENGKTDSIEYAWYVWGQDVKPGTWKLI